MSGCEKGKEWEQAFMLMQDLLDMSLRPDLLTLNSMISAYSQVSLWQQAQALLDTAGCEHGLHPDVVSYSAVISACGKAQQWQRVLELVARMELQSLSPSVVTYTTALVACQQAGQWQSVLGLLGGLVAQQGRDPVAIACAAAIGACSEAEQWLSAVSLEGQLHGLAAALLRDCSFAKNGRCCCCCWCTAHIAGCCSKVGGCCSRFGLHFALFVLGIKAMLLCCLLFVFFVVDSYVFSSSIPIRVCYVC
ncbi:unnamed protein product [Polarella glacialis]|uniref:Pentatricopeptide repeat-containing protein, chloroplastic n=1 Tax=Polarella glacialis TaxID=89957 RepID=A0A813H753_POLGL|nr:unnamed protein product [Polarella glacialis]